MGQALIGAGVFLGLAGSFILMYVLNKRVPEPEGCDSADAVCEICENEGTGCKFKL